MARLTARWLLPVAPVALVALLSACASVPLATMWKMRDLTVESFFQHDPAQMRVAIQTDRAMTRGAGQPEVEVEVRAKGKPPFCYAFALVPVDPSARSELPLDRPAANRTWSVFALSPAGIDAFRRARREVAVIEKGTETQFSLGVTMNDVFDIPDAAKSFPLRIDVALDRQDGYFTLVKETAVAVKQPARPEPAKPATPAPAACATT